MDKLIERVTSLANELLLLFFIYNDRDDDEVLFLFVDKVNHDHLLYSVPRDIDYDMALTHITQSLYETFLDID